MTEIAMYLKKYLPHRVSNTGKLARGRSVPQLINTVLEQTAEKARVKANTKSAVGTEANAGLPVRARDIRWRARSSSGKVLLCNRRLTKHTFIRGAVYVRPVCSHVKEQLPRKGDWGQKHSSVTGASKSVKSTL
jgi:hypothetical protein